MGIPWGLTLRRLVEELTFLRDQLVYLAQYIGIAHGALPFSTNTIKDLQRVDLAAYRTCGAWLFARLTGVNGVPGRLPRVEAAA
jgi:hypothetical protein